MNWMFDQESIDWAELSNLYKIAPLGDKKSEDLKIAFSNSRYNIQTFILWATTDKYWNLYGTDRSEYLERPLP